MGYDGFWGDRVESEKLVDELTAIKKTIEPYDIVSNELEDVEAMIELGMDVNVTEVNESINRLESQTFLSGQHDTKGCILSINAGVGGTEACEFASMLYRMYKRWGECNGYKCELVDLLMGDPAGIKRVSMRIEGKNAYGYCKSERGVHRLSRISPFDSNSKRQTSFASVDVIAEIDNTITLDIPDKDLRIDRFHAGGKGGQNVNKVETAIRITHIPSRVAVACQIHRTQHMNHETALRLLLSKLYAIREDEVKDEMNKFYGSKGSISWGEQIRSYVFLPHRMVKDLRTGVSTNDITSVLDGGIDIFINGWLRNGDLNKN
jgi:peptide chain release factor 2